MLSAIRQLSRPAIAISIIMHGLIFYFAFVGLGSKEQSPLMVVGDNPSVVQVSMYSPVIKNQAVEAVDQTTRKGQSVDPSHSVKKIKVRDIILPKLTSSTLTNNSSNNGIHPDKIETASLSADLSPISMSYIPEPHGSVNDFPDTVGSADISTALSRRKKSDFNTSSAPTQESSDSVDWLSMLPLAVAERVRSELPPEMSVTGLTCDLDIRLTADGTLADVSKTSGDPALCLAAKNILFKIAKFELAGRIPDSESHLKSLTISIK